VEMTAGQPTTTPASRCSCLRIACRPRRPKAGCRSRWRQAGASSTPSPHHQ
jgi:hypothetical protein